MYNFNHITHQNTETYNISLNKRIKQLDFSRQKKNIVYIYYEKDYGTFRYRAYNMCQVLNKTNDYASSFFFVQENELNVVQELLDNIDIVVFVRVPWTYELDYLIQTIKKKNIITIFDVDDLVFDISKVTKLVNNLGVKKEDLDFWFGYISRRFYTAQFADHMITTNQFLDAKIKNVFPAAQTFIIPNFMNDEQIGISKALYNLKIKNIYKNNKNFLIGYFSGTASHNHDFALIANDLEYILEKYPHVLLRIVGILELPPKLQKFESEGRILRMSLLNYIELQKAIAECDLNLIPLIENEFTNCKSELKFFESAIVGTPSIASPTFIYKKCITNGENGFTAEVGEWKDKIEKLISDKDLYNKIQKNAYTYALDNYYGNKIEEKILFMIQQVLLNYN